jgi:hypothetical protein
MQLAHSCPSCTAFFGCDMTLIFFFNFSDQKEIGWGLLFFAVHSKNPGFFKARKRLKAKRLY